MYLDQLCWSHSMNNLMQPVHLFVAVWQFQKVMTDWLISYFICLSFAAVWQFQKVMTDWYMPNLCSSATISKSHDWLADFLFYMPNVAMLVKFSHWCHEFSWLNCCPFLPLVCVEINVCVFLIIGFLDAGPLLAATKLLRCWSDTLVWICIWGILLSGLFRFHFSGLDWIIKLHFGWLAWICSHPVYKPKYSCFMWRKYLLKWLLLILWYLHHLLWSFFWSSDCMQPVVDAFDPRLLVAPTICHVLDFTEIKV